MSEVTDLDILKMGFTKDDPMVEYFLNLGKNAYEAATQVRTFSKMMDALKEAAQSGWAITFEKIIGECLEGDALGGIARLDEDFYCVHRKRFSSLDALCLELTEPCLYAFEVIFEVVRQLRSHYFLELLWVCHPW